MIRVPTSRAPSYPGEMLKEEFLIPGQRELAKRLKVSYPRINERIHVQD